MDAAVCSFGTVSRHVYAVGGKGADNPFVDIAVSMILSDSNFVKVVSNGWHSEQCGYSNKWQAAQPHFTAV